MGDEDELERLARKGTDRRARRRERERSSIERTRTRAESAERALAIDSLDRWARVRRLGVVLLMIGALVVVGQSRTGKPSIGEFFAIAGGALLALFLGLLLADRAGGPIAARELRRFGALPFRFPVDAYGVALGKQRQICSPRLTVTFAAPVSTADRTLIADAIEGVTARSRACWSGDELVIESEPIDTVFRPVRMRGGSTKDYFSNHRVHAWVRAVIDGALVPVHRRTPVQAVSVAL